MEHGQGVVLLGLQWGDEGKGKIMDLLAENVAATVRFQGGHNAGHTLVHAGQSIALHLIPSGIRHRHVQCLIGGGVVVDPNQLLKEMSELEKAGFCAQEQVQISPNCSLILPTHITIDHLRDQKRGEYALGTTGRGIGPAYEDKIARRGLRLQDIYAPDFERHLRVLHTYHEFLIHNMYGCEAPSFSETLAHCESARDLLGKLFVNIPDRLRELYEQGGNILFEGAQGAMLDIDHGTYPFVTSSNTFAAAAAIGSGFPPAHLHRVIGVCKAYATRVGNGPFVTELNDATGEHIARVGVEFGATTGRPRRCGWLDLVVLRSMIWMNSVSSICLSKIDVLDELAEIKICIAYEDGEEEGAKKPIYEVLPGWQSATRGISEWGQLPARAQAYVRRIEEYIGIPVAVLSTGPDRKESIRLRDPFAD